MLRKILSGLFGREKISFPHAPYYKVLGIKPGASPDAVKQAYEAQAERLMADLEQFSHDHRLKQRMEELIKELDDAYQKVTNGS